MWVSPGVRSWRASATSSGPVVNVASRLTSTSRPGRVLTDRALADELQDDEQFELRRLRRTSVKGYRRLEPWALLRRTDEG